MRSSALDAVRSYDPAYKNGKTKHLFVLKGLVQLVEGGRVQLKFRGGDHSAVVFEHSDQQATAGRSSTVTRSRPSSLHCAIAVSSKPLQCWTCFRRWTSNASATTDAHDGLAHIETLSHAYSVVYCMCVYGNRVFCGHILAICSNGSVRWVQSHLLSMATHSGTMLRWSLVVPLCRRHATGSCVSGTCRHTPWWRRCRATTGRCAALLATSRHPTSSFPVATTAQFGFGTSARCRVETQRRAKF